MQGILLLFGFEDARLGALTPCLHDRGLLLVRAESAESASVLLEHVQVRALVIAGERNRAEIAPVARKRKVALIVDPGEDPLASADQICAALT